MLDYAMLEAVELDLPFIVYLLDMARIELTEIAERERPTDEDSAPSVV